jgi:hypothetical protein
MVQSRDTEDCATFRTDAASLVLAMPAPDFISRPLANRISNKLAEVHNLVRVGGGSTAELAAKVIQDLVKDIWRYAESVEEADERARREQS